MRFSVSGGAGEAVEALFDGADELADTLPGDGRDGVELQPLGVGEGLDLFEGRAGLGNIDLVGRQDLILACGLEDGCFAVAVEGINAPVSIEQ